MRKIVKLENSSFKGTCAKSDLSVCSPYLCLSWEVAFCYIYGSGDYEVSGGDSLS